MDTAHISHFGFIPLYKLCKEYSYVNIIFIHGLWHGTYKLLLGAGHVVHVHKSMADTLHAQCTCSN